MQTKPNGIIMISHGCAWMEIAYIGTAKEEHGPYAMRGERQRHATRQSGEGYVVGKKKGRGPPITVPTANKPTNNNRTSPSVR